MNICSVKEISKIYGGNQIFSDITFDIEEGDRIGIVGNNGCGKTTIFKLLSGIENPDNGSIYLKKGTKVGYLEQLPKADHYSSVYQILEGAFSDLRVMEQRMKELESKMSKINDETAIKKLLEEYGFLQENFSRLGGYEIEAEIMKVTEGLGLKHLTDKAFHSLSGGEKTKVGLAVILLKKSDLLLLDEPTNHLDISSVEWLEQHINQYQGTVLLVSHDRYFLDKVVNKIFNMDNGELGIYYGNYSYYVKEKEERLLAEFAAYQDQQKKIKKMQEAIKRLREWANRANPPNESLHRRAASMEKALERIEKLKRPNINPKKINITFDVNERSGKDVILLEGVAKAYEEIKLFENININIHYGEQVALIGNNGSGKTTLLKIILGEESADQGFIQLGSNVKIGYLSQNVMNEYSEYTLIDSFRDKIAVTEEQARHILAKFLFYGRSVFKKVKDLSGGEKTRLKLAQLMYEDLNLLILDEPTNHLDIDSREQLEEALASFKGTIVCISHDRYFINKLFTKVYWLENQKITGITGNYDYAKQKREELASVNLSKVRS